MRTETASRPSDNATVAPIFIIASARSGSTLLRFLLDSHPSIACPPETNLVEACAALCNVARVLSTDCGSSPLGAQGMEQARTAIESLLGEYSRSRGKIRWCDKSLVSVLHADILGSIWPCAQFLCLYRHCMDVVYSGIQASPWGLHGYGFKPYGVAFPGNTVAALVAYWCDCTAGALRLEAKYPSQCLRLCYEELVTVTDTVTGAVFRFLNEEPVANIARVAWTELHDDGPSDYKIWDTDRVHPRSIGQGRGIPLAMVPPGLLSQANSLLNRLGYVPLDTALTTAGALDSLLKSKADATTHRNETTGTRSDRGPSPMRLVAMDGTREVDTTVVNWDCDGQLRVVDTDPQLCATTLLAQKQLLDLVKRGELNVATALRRGDLRIIGPQYPDLYVEHRDTVRAVAEMLRILSARAAEETRPPY